MLLLRKIKMCWVCVAVKCMIMMNWPATGEGLRRTSQRLLHCERKFKANLYTQSLMNKLYTHSAHASDFRTFLPSLIFAAPSAITVSLIFPSWQLRVRHFQNNSGALDPAASSTRPNRPHMSGVSQRLLCRCRTIILGQT